MLGDVVLHAQDCFRNESHVSPGNLPLASDDFHKPLSGKSTSEAREGKGFWAPNYPRGPNLEL